MKAQQVIGKIDTIAPIMSSCALSVHLQTGTMVAHAPVLETERLILRGWRESDLGPLAAFYADDPSAVFVGGPRRPHESALWLMGRMAQWVLRGYGAFVITERDRNVFLGWCGASQAPGVLEPDLQWALIGPARGKGYMVEAGRSVLDFLFKETGRELLHTTIHPENSSSQATALILGGAPNPSYS